MKQRARTYQRARAAMRLGAVVTYDHTAPVTSVRIDGVSIGTVNKGQLRKLELFSLHLRYDFKWTTAMDERTRQRNYVVSEDGRFVMTKGT